MSCVESKRYSVIYYKRSNKVHKGRGQTKLEGILHVFAPPGCQVRLYNNSDEEDEEEDTVVKKGRNNHISSCVNRDISMRVFGDVESKERGIGFEENDEVIVPQFVCEIISCISEAQQSDNHKKPTVMKSNNLRVKVTKTVKTNLLQRKRPNNSKFVVPVKMRKNSLKNPTNIKKIAPTIKTHIIAPLKASSVTENKISHDTTNKNDQFPGAIGQITVPSSISQVLRPHQKEGIAFLWNCLAGVSPDLKRLAKEASTGDYKESVNFNGAILADEMGLGKTLMTISIIYALNRKNRDHRFVVVCPSSLVSNWAKEFDKWLGKASQPKRVVVDKGGEDALRLIKGFVPLKPSLTEVLIISYEIFRMNSKVLCKSNKIQLMVVDEGHRLKNTSGSLTLSALNSMKCHARLLLSGTPLQNNLSEFYSIIQFVNPGILGDHNSFRRNFERPISLANSKQATQVQKAEGNSQAKALEKLTSKFMIRRLQKEVLKSLLPPRNEYLLFAKPTKIQCDIYESLTANIQIEGVSNSGATEDVLTILMKLRKICTHPDLLEAKSSYDKSCSEIYDGGNSLLSGKLFILEKLLQSIRVEHPEEKCIIVSNFTTALTIIERVISKNGWSSLRLDGSTKDRQSLVDSFNRCTTDHSFIFLLSSKAGGCGLNLIGANRLVMFDPDWNPATDLQAMARIYRQGQQKACFIYRLFTTGTIEEIILQRQMQKGNLATIAVDAQASSGQKQRFGGFSEEELRDCFTLKKNCVSDTKLKLGNKWKDYERSNSLREEGCNDVPLLKATCLSELSFVHVCREDPVLHDFETESGGIVKESNGTKFLDSDYSSEEEL